jgi:hypothetical protein
VRCLAGGSAAVVRPRFGFRHLPVHIPPTLVIAAAYEKPIARK